MSMQDLIDSLNEAQREAVTAEPGHMLVLAGAGSGKTRVLVHRMAWLMETQGVSPYAILAVTFTNKAAAEMRSRIEGLLSYPVRGMWVGTFHNLCHRLLRAHSQDANLPENFQILDSDDQKRLIRRVIRALDLEEDRWPPKQAQWYINKQKDEGLRPSQVKPGYDVYAKQMQRIYQHYEEMCQRGGLVDFAELLLRTFELLQHNPEILAHYQSRFQHILVDEFQDTNAVQYAWLRLLAGDKSQVMIVGDDDQSIYGWRGAKIKNIHSFSEDFPNTKTIRLEQNYRSSGNILAIANVLISHNSGRLGKELWTNSKEGEPIYRYEAFNEIDEARYVVSRIKEWTAQGNKARDAAILYRSNAQSRLFEEALLHENIPYRVYGGLRFFDRAEIKDTLAYLRLVVNRDDDAAIERIINTPTRGIGHQTLEHVRAHARAERMTLWQAAVDVINTKALAARALKALENFVLLIETINEDIAESSLYEQIEHAIQASGLLQHYRKEKGERGQARIENLEELVNAARQFELDEDETLPPLAAFLSHTALEAGDNQADAFEDYAQLMTLHSAKGLEFPLVFLCGLEEGLFPHKMSLEEPGRLEEERRLCYVGITRAMQQLYITHAERRRHFGQETSQYPSRFIAELPSELVEEVRMKNRVSHSQVYTQGNDNSFDDHVIDDTGLRMGQRVQHAKFGEGVIMNYEGQGSTARVQVRFADGSAKWLMASYLDLESI